MTRTEHQHPPRRTTRTPITAVLGGVVLAASVMFGTAVGPAAAAETPADIITRVCGNYVPDPTPTVYTDCSGRDLADANLTYANLTYANLTYANLTYANLTYAKLNNAKLYGANLTGTSVIPANITVAATSPGGATVTWDTPTMPDGLTFGGCANDSERLFAVGLTAVICAVTSLRYGTPTTGSGIFTVTVTAAPVINPPATGSLGSLSSSSFVFGS